MLFLFDLDGTMIDSSHRQNTLADGSLDLDNWIANNTPEKIMADTLLPLASQWKAIDRNRHSIVIMTARVIGDAYMFDDNKKVRDMMESESIRAFDPEPINNFSLGEL